MSDPKKRTMDLVSGPHDEGMEIPDPDEVRKPKSEPTQADRWKAVGLHDDTLEIVQQDSELHYQSCMQCRRVASELAAVREEAETEQRQNDIRAMNETIEMVCKRLGIPLPKNKYPCINLGEVTTHVEEKAHSAGAAEMVEQFRATIDTERESWVAEGEDRVLYCLRRLDSIIRRLFPNPNYLAEMRAGVREECAEIAGRVRKHVPATYNIAGEEIAHAIRSLDPTHSDVVEGMKQVGFDDALAQVAKWGEEMAVPAQEKVDSKMWTGTTLAMHECTTFDYRTMAAVCRGERAKKILPGWKEARTLLKEGE